MLRGFWRGVIAGSLLAAIMNMMKKPQRKPAEFPGVKRIRRMQPRRTADRMFKEMSRSVNSMMKRK